MENGNSADHVTRFKQIRDAGGLMSALEFHWAVTLDRHPALARLFRDEAKNTYWRASFGALERQYAHDNQLGALRIRYPPEQATDWIYKRPGFETPTPAITEEPVRFAEWVGTLYEAEE